MPSAIARVAARAARLQDESELQQARRSRRGPAPKPAWERRSHTVSVRMNDAELRELDGQRAAAGDLQRGEQLRMAWQGQAPEGGIPPFNQKAYAALARTSANLTQIAGHLGAGYGDTQRTIAEAAGELEVFRASLLTPLPADDQADVDVEQRVAQAASRYERKARRGPFMLPPGECRENVVAVRMNVAELDELDRQRRAGDAKRGEWLRMAWEALIPAERIPAITDRAYESLARSADTINSVAKYLNEGGAIGHRIELIDQELSAFLRNLRRAESSKL